MSAGSTDASVQTIALRLASSVFLSLLVTTGLLLIPVSCTCGASVPHSHSLFQLPHHNHGSVEVKDHSAERAAHAPGELHVALAGLSVSDDGCDEVNPVATDHQHERQVAFSNALEQHDGAVVQAPPTSSIGHPIAMTQPALISLAGQECECLSLPPARSLSGTDRPPETPPPRAFTTI